MKKRASILLLVFTLLVLIPLVNAQVQKQVQDFTSFLDRTIKSFESAGWLETVVLKKFILVLLIAILIYQALNAFHDATQFGNKTIILIISEIILLIVFTTIPANQIDSYLISLKTAALAALILFLFIGAAILSAKVSSIKGANGLWWFLIIIFIILALYRLPTAWQEKDTFETTLLIAAIIGGLFGKSLIPKLRSAAKHSGEKEEKMEQKITKRISAIIAFSFIILLILPFGSAQIDSAQFENYGNQIQNAQNTINSISEKDNISSAEFLTKSWINLIKDNKFIGPPIKAVDSLLIAFNPFLKVILQSDYLTQPGQFIISLTILILIIGIIYLVAGTFLEKNWIGFSTSVLIGLLIGLLGIIHSISTTIYVILPAALQASILGIASLVVIFLVFSLVWIRKKSKKLHIKVRDKLRMEQEDELEDRRIVTRSNQSPKR